MLYQRSIEDAVSGTTLSFMEQLAQTISVMWAVSLTAGWNICAR